jgi:hypothetical protein
MCINLPNFTPRKLKNKIFFCFHEVLQKYWKSQFFSQYKHLAVNKPQNVGSKEKLHGSVASP